MNYGRYKWSHNFLTWGLGIVFLWIGLDILQHPDTWIGYLPATLPIGLSKELALQMNGVLDVAIGVLLIMNWWPKIVAAIAAFHLLGILATQGLDSVLIRDVGLLGASLSLLMWPKRHHRSHNAA